MKKFKKIMSMVLVLLLLSTGVTIFPTNIFAASSENTIKINNEVLEFDKVIYVDALSGDDATGNGSKENPYKTFNVAHANIVSDKNQAIYLQKGDYICSIDDKELKFISILGLGADTKLSFDHASRDVVLSSYTNASSWGVKYGICKINFINLVFKANVSDCTNAFFAWDSTFNNVVFDITGAPGISVFISLRTVFNNCIDLNSTPNILRGDIILKNSYGLFSKSTYDEYTQTITSLLETANVDETYNIVSEGWKNTGTGTNPDETIANIGVYGGPYAWGNWSNQPEEPEIPQNKTLKIVLEPTEKLQLSVNDDIASNTDIIWTTSDESIASVDTTGLVNALKASNATITATSKDSKYTSDIKILVVNNADKCRLSIDLNIGETCRLTVDDATDTIPTIWTSSDPSVAAISEKGKVTATNKGLTIMTATDSEGTIIGQVYIRIR